MLEVGKMYRDPERGFTYRCSKVFDEGVVLYNIDPNYEKAQVIKAYDQNDPFLKELKEITDEEIHESMKYLDQGIRWHENKISINQHRKSIYQDELERRRNA